MSSQGLILTLFMTLFFASCQVKEGSSDSVLYSGHLPTTNSFTLVTPTSKTYTTGGIINLSVTFPFDIIADTSGGSPRLKLTIGSTTKYATSVASTDPTKLNFQYTVTAADNDSNGIDVVALELNGSVLQFDKDSVLTNCDVTTLTNKNLAGVKVDTAAPTVTAFQITNIPSATAILNVGKKVKFNMTFSEKVYLVGSTPEFLLTFDTGSGYAVYVSGSGTTTLSFEYVVTSSVMDLNGYNGIASPLDIGAGTLKDAVGNNANLDFSSYVAAAQAYSAGVRIGGQYPSVVAVTLPADGVYLAAQDLDFVFEFDREINVTGSPYLEITVGTTTRQAQYVSDTNPTKFVTFRYTTVPGDVDADGISVLNSLTQNSGDIEDSLAPNNSFFSTDNNVYTVPDTSGIILNAIQPQAITVTRNTDITSAVWGTALDNVWNIGQVLNITVGFNTKMYVGQSNGTPGVSFTIGSTTKEATYLSGGDGQTSLVFQYQVVEGDLDPDGTLTLNGINLNGGTLTDASNTNSLLTLPVAGLTSTSIDGVRPTISSVTPPANQTFSNQSAVDYTKMIFVVNWSEAVNYSGTGSIAMDVGGTANPLVNSAGNNSATVSHTPSSSFGSSNDSDGVTLSSPMTGTVVKDQAGNTANSYAFTLPNTSGLLVDTIAPTVTSISQISSSGTYKSGETIDFSVTFSETVTVQKSGGYPRIPITVGASTKYMIATTNGTGTTHTFRYTVANNEVDTDGITTQNIVQNNTGYVRDAGQNPATSGLAQTFPGAKVDAKAPTITSVTKTANGTYESGDTLQISLVYSENVTVDTTGGTPRIAVTIGSNTRYFTYNSGSGTTTLVFQYTLTTSDFDPDGLPSAITTLSLNGGTIQDVGRNSSPTSFTSQNLSSIYAVFPNTSLWVQYDFVSKAKAGSPAVTNGGAIGTLDTCGSTPCRQFDGDDSLSVASLNSVKTVFIAFKTPATVSNDMDLFGTDIVLDAKFFNFDLITSNATIYVDGGGAQSGTSFNLNMATSSTHYVQVDFSTTQNENGSLIDSTFNGSIAEIMAITGTLTSAQKTTILNYFAGKY